MKTWLLHRSNAPRRLYHRLRGLVIDDTREECIELVVVGSYGPSQLPDVHADSVEELNSSRVITSPAKQSNKEMESCLFLRKDRGKIATGAGALLFGKANASRMEVALKMSPLPHGKRHRGAITS